MKKLLYYCCLFIIVLFSASCVSAARVLSISDKDFVLNTIVTITLYDSDDPEILDECFRIIREKEKLLSRTVKDSDVYKLNNSNGAPTKVSPQTYELIQRSIYYSEKTNGAYDITICPIVDLWDFSSNDLPDESDITSALSKVSYKNIEMLENDTIILKGGAQIDLGSIAKGYIADFLSEYLLSQGVKSAIIDLGGNIIAHGKKYDGSMWKIGIQKPFEDKSSIVGYIDAENLSVVSSGIYERYFYLGDDIYHHLIDTSTGYPLNNELTSVTIFSNSSADGDALSTSCYLLGLENGLELINETEDTEAIFIDLEGNLHFSNGIGSEIIFHYN